ncbi:hypothetical protein Cni_G17179 [Canna indica]|uniref:Uncharacterized protein n=1 Tax=Canna indica TaxID=4628 RepID=A0AAQ3KM82_9LILI|nr:hypothetical protein Cni_G17179 [Canna indica]
MTVLVAAANSRDISSAPIFPLQRRRLLPNTNTLRASFKNKKRSTAVASSLSFSTSKCPPHVQAPPPPSLSLPQQLSVLCARGSIDEALRLLLAVEPAALPPLADGVGLLLQACGTRGELELGRSIHSLVASSEDLMSNPVLTTRLLTMYFACGSLYDARCVFDQLPNRNLFQWNALISGYARNNLFGEAIDAFLQLMYVTRLRPDNFTLPCVLKSCAGMSDVPTGKAVHGVAVKLGLGSDTFVNNSLISMYGKCGCIDDAAHLFETMPERNLVSWNTMMSVFSDNALLQDGFDLFREMLLVDEENMRPDDATVVTVLPMCTVEGRLEMGRAVHGLSVKLDLDHELRVSNALVDMYAKCDCLSDAQCLFGNNQQRNVVSWNAMIGGFSRIGDIEGTLDLLRKMHTEGIKANEVTILNVLPACLGPSELPTVKELHAYVTRNGLQSNDLVPNALIAAYAKCGLLDYADDVFNGVEVKTISAWNALIGGYAQNGDPIKALELFLQMSCTGLEPDWFSIGSLLLACAHLRNLLSGKSLHGFVLRNGLENDSFILISLMSLYIHCGQAKEARFLFNSMEDKDFISWNAMIAGYCQNGLPEDSLHLFRRMLHDGYEPSVIATTSAFMACSELSALRLGQEAHCHSLKTGFVDDTFLGSSIIDMYAKCGSVEQARTFFNNLKDKDVVSWTVMITGYGINGFGYEAVDLYNKIERHGLKPDAFTYVGILTACNHAGLVEEGLRYFEEMKNKHGMEPKLEHYACVADMLGRVGKLAEASRIIEEMPEEPDGRIWSALLSACRTHGDICLGERVVEKLLELEPDKAEHYVLASNLYAGAERWDCVGRIRNRMKELKQVPAAKTSSTDSKLEFDFQDVSQKLGTRFPHVLPAELIEFDSDQKSPIFTLLFTESLTGESASAKKQKFFQAKVTFCEEVLGEIATCYLHQLH